MCIIFSTMHNAVEFYHFFHCTVENLLQCSAVETPGTEGIIFSSGGEEERRRGGEERMDGGGRITFSSARGKKEEDCSLPKRLFTICSANNQEKKSALTCEIEF